MSGPGIQIDTNLRSDVGDVRGDGWSAPTTAHVEVRRRRLDHLYASSPGRLMRVLAPSGYGKTNISARWVASEQRCVRWVGLSRGDDDPVALFSTLRDALDGIFEIPTPTIAHAGSADPYVRAIEDGLTRGPPARAFVLVLDDVHRIRSTAGNWLIETVIDHLPNDSTVLLIGRGHHDHGSVGRFRLAPGVVDVDADDLAFDSSEGHRLLALIGVDARSDEIVDVLNAIEGWPAGILLAGEVLRSGTPPREIADHVNLIDFLRGEWVGQLDGEELAFLREAACLGQFTSDLCDEVLQRAGSADLLRRLHRDRVVVFALDQRGELYRLHGLLVRWLSTELRSADPERWAEIHVRAARFWESQGDVDRAVEHARIVGDLDVLEEMVAAHGGRYFTSGLHATVDRWLESFPIDFVRSSPGLIGLRTAHAINRGDDERAVQWLRVLDDVVRSAGNPSEDPPTWWAAIFHAALDERPATEMIPSLVSARHHLGGGPWGAFACWVHGALNFVVGDLDAARSALNAGAFEAEIAQSPITMSQCMAVTAIIDDCEGHHVDSATLSRRAAEAIRSCGAELLPTTATSMALTALHHARQNERDEAARGVAAARRALTGFRSVAPWFNVIPRIAIVKTALLLDDHETARSVMLELEHHARFDTQQAGNAPGSAAAIVCELRTQVDAMHRPMTGSMALTGAELRVLSLLPTNLSLADIASDLYISRNTVKSHVAAIYRKLDATKRTDAVDRARSAGLIADPKTA
ncbi:LuxR C-terminal-related transcriptional regulator [Ilumatobacter sp.]|uniref:helix-turn-helix transcriptional regulator n=1 Tax=Ilumatobacter sp. TaxID=1967498 RepID=UPI003C440F42